MKYIKLFESTLKLHPDIVKFLDINQYFKIFSRLLDLQHDENATEILNYLRPGGSDGSVYFSNDKKQIVDRIYYTHEWNINKIMSWVSENLPESISTPKNTKINLNEWKFKYYPWWCVVLYRG